MNSILPAVSKPGESSTKTVMKNKSLQKEIPAKYSTFISDSKSSLGISLSHCLQPYLCMFSPHMEHRNNRCLEYLKWNQKQVSKSNFKKKYKEFFSLVSEYIFSFQLWFICRLWFGALIIFFLALHSLGARLETVLKCDSHTK